MKAPKQYSRPAQAAEGIPAPVQASAQATNVHARFSCFLYLFLGSYSCQPVAETTTTARISFTGFVFCSCSGSLLYADALDLFFSMCSDSLTATSFTLPLSSLSFVLISCVGSCCSITYPSKSGLEATSCCP